VQRQLRQAQCGDGSSSRGLGAIHVDATPTKGCKLDLFSSSTNSGDNGRGGSSSYFGVAAAATKVASSCRTARAAALLVGLRGGGRLMRSWALSVQQLQCRRMVCCALPHLCHGSSGSSCLRLWFAADCASSS
jgi:hypothetical protein